MEIKVLASGSTGNVYRIRDGQTSLLLDAGIPLKAIQIGCGFRLAEISGCFLTHAHADHTKAAKDLMRFGMDVYASQGTIDACGLAGHRIRTVKSLEHLNVRTFTVMPFDVQHDVQEPLGYVITSTITEEKLLYFTDSYYIKYRFPGLTHIMGECNYDRETLMRNIDSGLIHPERAKRILKSHMSLEHFGDLLRANDLSKVRQIYLLHMSQDNSDERRCREEIQKITGCEVYVPEALEWR